MGYPAQPAADGDLIAGDLTNRTWRRFTAGTENQVLKVNTISGTFDLEWSDDLGVKTFQSDFTLIDEVGGAENMVMRVTNATSVLSIVTTHTDQLMYLGGHAASAALSISRLTAEHVIEPSASRTLRVEGSSACVMANVPDTVVRVVPTECDVIVNDRYILHGTGSLSLQGDAQLVVL